MKIFQIVCLFAALAIPPFALAKLAIPSGILGKVEASFDFCAKLNPQSAAKYAEKKKAFVQGASDQELAEARASKEYKEGYDAGTDEMGKEPKDEAKKMCAAALESK